MSAWPATLESTRERKSKDILGGQKGSKEIKPITIYPVKRQRNVFENLRCVFVITYSMCMPFSIFPFPTMTKQLGVGGLLKDDDSRPKRREGHVQTTATREGPELRGEVLQVGP